MGLIPPPPPVPYNYRLQGLPKSLPLQRDRDTQPLPILPDPPTWVQLWRWRLGRGERARVLPVEVWPLFQPDYEIIREYRK